MTKSKPAPLPAAATQRDWLLKQAVLYFKRSEDGRSPGSRALNRRKFCELVRQLLPVVGQDRVSAEFNPYSFNGNGQTARAIIAELAAEPAQVQVSDPLPAIGNALTLHLAAATRELVAALKLLQPSATETASPAKPF